MNRGLVLIALESWLPHAQAVVARGYLESEARSMPVLSIEAGPRYARIVRTIYGNQRSAWGFVDLDTGDLLKADNWKRPAKGARGSVLEPLDMRGVYWTGVR